MADPGVPEPPWLKVKLLFSLQQAYIQFINFTTGFIKICLLIMSFWGAWSINGCGG